MIKCPLIEQRGEEGRGGREQEQNEKGKQRVKYAILTTDLRHPVAIKEMIWGE